VLIQPTSAPSTVNTATNVFTAQPQTSSQAANVADSVTISQAARDALAASATTTDSTSAAVDAKLKQIVAEGPLNRSAEDMNYLITNDPKLAAIYAKTNQNNGSGNLTAEELDYQQKTIGFVNTMAYLSPAEKSSYDKMVASGNTAAAAGMSDIAFERATLGHTAATADGVTYDPINTAITPENIVKYFSQSIGDPTGKTQSQFQALIQYLQNNPTTT
jgi:hypothetical protein